MGLEMECRRPALVKVLGIQPYYVAKLLVDYHGGTEGLLPPVTIPLKS